MTPHPTGRILVWFSHGAASTVALKTTLEKHPGRVIIPVYCDVSRDEHTDNSRFRADVERWLNVRVEVISSEKFETCDEVFEKTRYISGPRGARCTTELKKLPRLKFQEPDDTHVFGFTADRKELKRIRDFEAINGIDLHLEWVLRDAGIYKNDCYKILSKAGIQLPEMYRLGYRNNNCLGCVKSTSPGYWEKIWRDFPDKFHSRAVRSRALGVRLVELHKQRIFLDELEALLIAGHTFKYKGENLSCGPECKG